MAGVKGRSGKLAGRDARDFSLLVNRCYNYLLHNFSKLSPEKRLHIALEIIKKAMPMNVQGEVEITHHLAERIQDSRMRAAEVTPSAN